MASSSTTYFSIFLLLTLLSSNFHAHARDSQFFSKVTNQDIVSKQVVPTKEQPPLTKQPQDSTFVPQNQQNSGGYGLFGQESAQLPTTTTTTTENLPYKSEPENTNYHNLDNSQYYNNNDAYVNTESYTNPNNDDHYYNNDVYVAKPQGMSDTRFMDNAYRPYTTSINNNNNYNNMYNNNKEQAIGGAKLGVRNGNNGGNMYNNEKQGMSDTRFLENGRYYHDLNNENTYNNNNFNANENSRNEVYNNRGNFYGNSFKGQNNENSNNYMQGYNGNQEEFQEVQDERFMP